MDEDKFEVLTCHFFAVLALMFIWLKLNSVITWNWFMVLSPIWGPALAVGIFLILTIIFLRKKDDR